MTYQPFELRVIPIFFYYIGLVIFSLIITLKMYLKWKERKVRPPLLLTIVFSILTIALIALTIGLAEAIITGYYKEIYRFTLPFAYSCIAVADVFLFIFASNIMNKGKKLIIPLSALAVVIIILLFLPWNWWGYPSEDYVGKLNIRLYSTLTLILFSYLIFIYIAIICQKVKKNTEDKIMKMGLTLLFYSMICMILFFLMLIFDTLLVVIIDHPGYSEFVYVAWVFAILFYLLSYMSLIMPKWLVARISK